MPRKKLTGDLAENLTPPHDLEAEEAVLGSLLIDPTYMAPLAGSLKPMDFFREKHRWVYETCLRLFEQQTPTNQISVAHDLSRRKLLEPSGGTAFLGHLVAQVPTSKHCEHYATIVRNTATQRKALEVLEECKKEVWDSSEDVATQLAKVKANVLGLDVNSGKQRVMSPKDMQDYRFERYGKLRQEGDVMALSTGLRDLDEEIGGLRPGDLVIIGARPAMGKTSLTLTMTRGIKAPCLYCSAEMSKAQIADRETVRQTKVPMNDIWKGKYTDQVFEKIMTSIEDSAKQQIWWIEGQAIGTSDIEVVATELKARGCLSAIFVDYIQILKDEYGKSLNERTSYISRRLKTIAMSLEVPVVAVSQLSRGVESRSTKTPMLSDLRDSGAIEQDADIVALLYRTDYYYHNRMEFDREGQKGEFRPGILEINLKKQRQGKSGRVVEVVWLPNSLEYGDIVKRGVT